MALKLNATMSQMYRDLVRECLQNTLRRGVFAIHEFARNCKSKNKLGLNSLELNFWREWVANQTKELQNGGKMKRDLATHFSFMIALFALASVFNKLFSLNSALPFWIGGILGTLLPDIDHLLYVYLLHPSDSLSEQIVGLVQSKQYVKTWDTLVATRFQRTDLLFHTASFQLLFLVFAFLIVTSSNSYLGKGIVLAFALHLIIDQIYDFRARKEVDPWFQKFPLNLDMRQKRFFIVANAIAYLFLAVMI